MRIKLAFGALLQPLMLLLLLLLVCCAHYAAAKVTLIEHTKDAPIERVALEVCQDSSSSSRQIGYISTVAKLAEFLRDLPASSSKKLTDCRDKFGLSIEQLQAVLQVSNQNVCSPIKISSIDQFHRRYISTNSDDISERKSAAKAPHLVRLFFMHYAMEVAAMCRKTLISNLEFDVGQLLSRHEMDELMARGDDQRGGTFGNLFNGVMAKFMDINQMDRFDDAVLFWDIIKGSYLAKQDQRILAHDHQVGDLDPVTGEPARLFVRLKSGRALSDIQLRCHRRFKPFYSKLILPIIRLSNLGYSNDGTQFEREIEELRGNRYVHAWYALTQLCETLLPVKTFEDQQLEGDQVVAMTREEALEWEQKQQQRWGPAAAAGTQDDELSHLEPIEYEPTTNTMAHVDLLESVQLVESQKLVAGIKTKLSARDRAVRRILRLLMKQVMTNLSPGKFYFSKPKDEHDDDEHEHEHEHADTETSSSHAQHEYEKVDVSSELSPALADLDEDQLLEMTGGVSKKPVVNQMLTKPGYTQIKRQRGRRRRGDDEEIAMARAEVLSYKHTKSWDKIKSEWGAYLKSIAPNRRAMFGVAIVLTIITIFIVWLTVSLAALLVAG